MLPNIATMLDQLYLKLANRVHYAGANAGSETFQLMPCLFDSKRMVSDAVLAVLVRHHHGAILEHEYHLPDQFHTASSTDWNRIAHIDWKPAFEVYYELVRTQYGVEITRGDSVETVKRALAESGLPPHCLELELAESILIQDTETTLEIVHQLKLLGVTFP